MDAFDKTGRGVFLPLAIHRLGLYMERTVYGHQGRGDVSTTLGSALRIAAAAFGDPRMLDDSVGACRLAIEEDGSRVAAYWSNLAHALRDRFDETS
ncbi:hypothetical protein ACIBL3_41030 [Kribbella sp. NPDC050124]|uniref:hypothetical protein n=1 Tax=Kribbella sp. NPDC050124 TaxID=3364114 RepID=UPI003788EAB6